MLPSFTPENRWQTKRQRLMEAFDQKSGWQVWVLSGLTLALLTAGIYYWNQNQQLIQQKEMSKQATDSLVSVKLQLEGDVQQLTNKVETAGNEQEATNQRVLALTNEVANHDNTIKKLVQTKTSSRRTVDQLTRQLDRSNTRYTIVLDSMTNQMNAMGGKIGWLTDSNTVLTDRNTQLATNLEKANSRMLTMVPRSSLTGDNFRVEAKKPNRKETAKAKKVHTITISLNVPAELGLTGQQEVYLSLTDEQHNAAIPPLRTMTVTLPTINDAVPIHAAQTVTFGSGPQQVVFTLQPPATLKPGLYRAAVYTKDTYLGSIEYRFRDSFWFF